MSELRAPGPCCDCGDYTPSGRVVDEVHQGTAGGASIVQCRRCEADPELASRLYRNRMRQVRSYPA